MRPRRTRSPHSSRGVRFSRLVALALLLVVVATGAPRAQSGPPRQSGLPGSSGSSKGQSTPALAHLDTAIAERLAHGKDDELVRVIVTVRPGAKQRGLLRAIEAHSRNVEADLKVRLYTRDILFVR